MQDKKSFDEYVYTPWRDAISILNDRQQDTVLDTSIKHLLPEGPPHIMITKKCMVLGRHVATPNYEMHRFAMCADVLKELNPIIFEYLGDKFTDTNSFKASLGKLRLYRAAFNSKEPHFEYRHVAEMQCHKCKSIEDMKTMWGESLVGFHHKLFTDTFNSEKFYLFDATQWLHRHGNSAEQYYLAYMSLFLKHGILFENFSLTHKEKEFTTRVVLATISKMIELTGYKPLIVALEPTDLEDDRFWYSYPFSRKTAIDNLIQTKA